MAVERRQFPRVTLLCKMTAIFGERLLIFNSHTENVSAGGMRIILGESLYIQTELDVELFLPDRESPVKCKGKVVWVKEMSPRGAGPRFFDTGIEFAGVSEADRELLTSTINALLTQVQRNTI